MEAATRVLALARSRAPTLGAGRLVCVDGPAGSGKTTLAAAILDRDPSAQVVHVDDLLDGWTGLSTLAERLDPLLQPLAHGEAGTYRRYDWLAEQYAETITVAPSPLLVLEGVGSGARRHRALCTVLAWVEVDSELRLRRGMARDGETMRAQWKRWMVEEQVLFADENTHSRADLVV